MIIRPDVDLTKEEVRELGAFNDVYIDLMFEAGQDLVKLKCKEYITGNKNQYHTYADVYKDND